MGTAPLDEPEFRRWRAQSDHTLALAERTAEGAAFDWACFLAEQATQLAVKALLHGVGRSARGHDLVKLGQAARSAVDDRWPSSLDDRCMRLSRLYISTRYPDAVPGGTPADHYGNADAVQALEDARAVITAVDASWEDLSR